MSQSAVPQDDWESHWASFGDAARGNPANVFRSNIIAGLLGNLDARHRLIDIGCGTGDLLVDMHDRFPQAQLLGVDISEEGISRARALMPSASFLRADLLESQSMPEEYRHWATHAVCSEVLEHLDDPTTFLRHSIELLQPGSPIVITVPAGPRSRFDRFIGHRRHFSPKRLRAVLVGAGLEVKTVRRAGFPFFTIYRLSVIARGDRLIHDAQTKGAEAMTFSVRAMFGLFGLLFRFNLPSFPLGWQLIALARVPTD